MPIRSFAKGFYSVYCFIFKLSILSMIRHYDTTDKTPFPKSYMTKTKSDVYSVYKKIDREGWVNWIYFVDLMVRYHIKKLVEERLASELTNYKPTAPEHELQDVFNFLPASICRHIHSFIKTPPPFVREINAINDMRRQHLDVSIPANWFHRFYFNSYFKFKEVPFYKFRDYGRYINDELHVLWSNAIVHEDNSRPAHLMWYLERIKHMDYIRRKAPDHIRDPNFIYESAGSMYHSTTVARFFL